jgi:hypothetical protein
VIAVLLSWSPSDCCDDREDMPLPLIWLERRGGTATSGALEDPAGLMPRDDEGGPSTGSIGEFDGDPCGEWPIRGSGDEDDLIGPVCCPFGNKFRD